MGMPEPQPDRTYTYADYLKWPEGERWELIDGRAYALAPAPLSRHQRVLGVLFNTLYNFLAGKACEAFVSPMDVRLPQGEEADETVETVVQPDVLVVCDPAKVDEKGVRGAPDLIIEILSESTKHKDQTNKLQLYERHGVRCYIIADPWNKTLEVHYLESSGHYGPPENFSGNDQMPVKIFEGLVIDLARVFGRV